MTQETGENIAGRLCDWDREGEKPVPLMQEAAAYIRHRIAAETASAARVAELEGALGTSRDYVSDAAKGFLTYEDSGDGFIAMATEDLACIDAALAHTTTDADDAGGV